MTEQEAIKALDRCYEVLCNSSHIDKKRQKAFIMAYEALGKQIAKKMDKRPHTDLDAITLTMYVCPTCETEYNMFYENKPYCMFCGQKLDWE